MSNTTLVSACCLWDTVSQRPGGQQVPSNIIVGKVKYPGVYICAAMAVWGMISACMIAVQSYADLVLARFFIGFIEAVFFPGALY
jgi:hypothetical protein